MQLELIDTWRLMLLPAEPKVKYYSYQTFLLFVDSLSYENFSRLKTFQNLDYNPKMLKLTRKCLPRSRQICDLSFCTYFL